MWKDPIDTSASMSAKIKGIGASIKPNVAWFVKFFRNKQNDSKMVLILALIAIGCAAYFLFMVISNLSALKKQIPQLKNLNSYDTRALESNILTRNFIQNANTLYDLVEEKSRTQEDLLAYKDYLQASQTPYDYLLQYIYLPSLNIWSNPYTQQIDIELMGLQYLEKNPYNDITLLQRRSDFFRNVWENNESNEVSDIDIGNIVEDSNWYFNIPITVSFVANSKRAFLLLVDKLSMTSNRDNISLLNEFFYYLWAEVKKSKQNEIKELTETYQKIDGFTSESMTDKVIGYHLYQWIYHNETNKLIDKSVLEATIKSIVSCADQSDEVCYYQFREKYRNIPTFGYMITSSMQGDPALSLKKFLLTLPPVFSLKEFTFDKAKALLTTEPQATKYKGRVTIWVYGKGISSIEKDAIAKVLGDKCFGNNQNISTSVAIERVAEGIDKIADIDRIDKSQSDKLRELKYTLEKIQSEYDTLTPYKQTVRLFEIYRMLSDVGLCK